MVEILVSLVVVAILLLLIVPVAGRIMGSAKDSSCLSNLKRVGEANLAFVSDNNGLIAAGSSSADYWWMFQLPLYLDVPAGVNDTVSVLLCPADPDKGWGNPRVPYPIMRRSYAINSTLQNGTAPYGPKRLLEFSAPSRVIYAGDTGKSAALTNWLWTDAGSLNLVPSSRHAGCTHFVFLDGHVASFKTETLLPGRTNSGIFADPSLP